MKNLNLIIKLTCIIPALLILCMANLKAQTNIIGYTYLGYFPAIFDNWSLHYYYLSNCQTTWEEANDAATEMGGYLATPTWKKNTYLGEQLYYRFTQADFENGVWIGFRGVNGIYEWANGEPGNEELWGVYVLNNVVYLEPFYADGAARMQSDPSNWYSYPVSSQARYIIEFPDQPNCNSANKSYVCHNGNTICVNNSAVQSHLNHGDLAGPCGPCNPYAMQAPRDETSAIDGQSLQSVKAAPLEPEEENDVVNLRSQSNQIHVFPNPASEEIQVELPQLYKEGTLRILSLTGQEIHVQPLRGQRSISFDLSSYTAGIYMIDVRCSSGHYQKKFVKL